MRESVQKYILSILERLNDRLGNRTGSDYFTIGGDGRLWLWIYIPEINNHQSIIFDEDYEDIEPEEVVDGIMFILSIKYNSLN